jgi:FkbM family methyltransferase
MGFGRFGFWRSELVEAANTWKYGENQERLGISLNISAIKEREPLVDIAALAHHIRHRDLKESFMVLVRNLLVDKGQLTGIGEIDAVLFQKLNFQYLDAANLAAHYRERLEQTACVPGASDAAATRDAGSLLSRSVVRARPTQERAAHQPSNAAIPDEIEHSSGHLLRGGILQKLLEIGQEAIARLVNIEIKINDLTRDMRLGFGNIPRQLGGVKVASAPSDDAFAQFAGSSDQAFGHLTYAQHGEDLIVANIFALLKIEHPTYLDVGANHPIVGSNTALLYARGSRGIAVEANPALLPLWQELRPGDVALNLAVGTEKGELTLFRIDEFSGRNTTSRSVAEDFVAAYPQFRVQDMLKVKATTLNDIVAEHTGGNWPDFLSIDLEGLDYAVLAVADFSFGRPTVLCVEWRDASGGDESARFFPLLDVQGFVPVFRTWGNLIAVHRSAIAALGLGAAD